MQAFLIDKIQQRCCRLSQAARTVVRSKARLWRKLRSRFDLCLIPYGETLYRSIIAPPPIPLGADTSQPLAVTDRARRAVLSGTAS